MAKRWKERLKSAVIVILTLSILLLAALANWPEQQVRSPFFSQLAALLGLEARPAQESAAGTGTLTDAAKPILISLHTDAGRRSYWRDFAALDSAYESMGSLFGQALDTAGQGRQVSQSQWCRALSGSSLLFSYQGQIPARLLAAWLDAGFDGGEQAQSYLLSLEDGAVFLYADTADGAYWRYPTEVAPQSLTDLAADQLPDKSAFAFESQEAEFRSLDPMTLVLPSAAQIRDASARTLSDPARIQQLATLLGFNPYDGSNYTDAAGTVFNEVNATLRVGTDGLLELVTAGQPAADTDDAALVETARALLDAICQALSTDARLYFTGLTQEDNQATVSFDFLLDGLPIAYSDGPGAAAVFENGQLTRLRVHLRSYTLSGASLLLLPQVQAAAIAPAGGRLRMEYADLGGDSVTAGWIS